MPRSARAGSPRERRSARRELRLRRLELGAGGVERACDVCSAVDEMKFCAARPTLAVCWRSASSSVACADSTIAERSLTRVCRSERSISPIDCPALTRLPSATASDSSVPGALARTTAVRGATSGPENSTTTGIFASTGRATSAGVNSSGTDLFLALAVARPATPSRCRGAAPGRAPRDRDEPENAPPTQILRRVLVVEFFMAASVGLAASRPCRVRPTADWRGPAAGNGDEAPSRRGPPGAVQARRGRAPGRASSSPPRPATRRWPPRRPRRSRALAQGAAGDAAEHARGAVAEHGVERLAAAAQPPREVARDDGDARRVLGGEGDACSSWATTSTATPRRRRRSRRSAAPTRRRRAPASRASAGGHPAALEREPGDLDHDADRPEQPIAPLP
jgi:hypothetical protein